MYKAISADDAVKVIKNNDRVYLHAAAAAPQALIQAMTNRHEELRNVEVCHYMLKEMPHMPTPI